MPTEATAGLLVSKANGIVTLTLNRPEKRNAMHGPLIAELLRVIKNISHDDSVKVLLINGNGEHFCAGADIGWMQKIAAGPRAENYHDASLLSDLLYQLYCFKKPTIVLAHGVTFGGGLGLLSVCDMAIAANNARFGFPEVKIGIAPSIISPYVISAIGERAASYYFLTGETFEVAEANHLGLIHHVIAPEKLMLTGIDMAKTLLQNSPEALIAVKKLIRLVKNKKITHDLTQMTAEHLADLRASPQGQEGLNAFIEKRQPKWS